MIKRASLKKKKKCLKNSLDFQPVSSPFHRLCIRVYTHVHTRWSINTWLCNERAPSNVEFFFFFFSLSVYPRYLSIFWYWFYRLWKQLERNRSPAKEHQDSSEESFETHVRKISANCRIKCSVSWNVYHWTCIFFYHFYRKNWTKNWTKFSILVNKYVGHLLHPFVCNC